MDMELLIELAVKAVKKYLAAEGLVTEEAAPAPVRKKYALVLTEEHCKAACAMEKISCETCGVTCALMENYDVDIDCYDAVVLYNMTNANLFKLANGCTDSKYLCLAAQAILKGKRVLMVKEDVEILQYAETCARALYENIRKNLQILLDSGVELVSEEEAIGILREAPAAPAAQPAAQQTPSVAQAGSRVEGKVFEITKKVITEKDIREAWRNQCTAIRLPKKPVITSLAKDTARDLEIEFLS